MIAYESLLERDYFLLLEFNNSVSSYEEQPLAIEYQYGGQIRTYTPDALVFFTDPEEMPLVVEIKFSSEIKSNKVFLTQKFEAIEKYLHDNDMRFAVFTEMDIRTQFLENAWFLYQFARKEDYNDEKLDRIVAIVLQKEKVSIADLLEILTPSKFEQSEYLRHLYHLLCTQKISIDLNKKIDRTSILTAREIE